jgi:hypothetical protein
MAEQLTLESAARELVKALAVTNKALDKYYETARAVGYESGDPIARGMSPRQLRQTIQNFVIARLSPKPTPVLEPVLQFPGAPEARRHCQNHPLPGLPR